MTNVSDASLIGRQKCSILCEFHTGASKANNWDTNYAHKRPTPFYKISEASPLQKRAWTLQGRLLSRRTLSFSTHQVYFEYETTSLGENKAPYRMYDMNSTAKKIVFEPYKPPEDDAKNHMPLAAWYGIVEESSKRRLTKEEDIFPALSGLVHRLQSVGWGKYAADIWPNHSHQIYAGESLHTPRTSKEQKGIGHPGLGHPCTKAKLTIVNLVLSTIR